MLTPYEEQIEAGKQIVSLMLSPRAVRFCTTDRDFDSRRISLLEGTKVVAKIRLNDLADCVTDESVLARLKNQLQVA